MRALRTSLSHRNADDVSGAVLVNTYIRMLGHHPAEAINFMCQRVLATCQWFPTIAECERIISAWERGDMHSRRRDAAQVAVRHEMQARFDETMTALGDGHLSQDQIDALPDRWKRIAAERCLLWHGDDGTFTVRKQPPLHDETIDGTQPSKHGKKPGFEPEGPVI